MSAAHRRSRSWARLGARCRFAKITNPDMTLRRVPVPASPPEPTIVTTALRARPKTSSVPELVDSIIQMALARRASDIHFEPNEHGIAVRFRVDGLLQNVEQITVELRAAVISRIKIMGNMDISEHRLPQDGRIKIRQKHQSVDIRISTMPSLYGEKVVMRLLDLDNAALPLSGTGVGPTHLKELERLIRRPQGVIRDRAHGQRQDVDALCVSQRHRFFYC